MKKFSKILAIFVLVLCFSCTFLACNNSDKNGNETVDNNSNESDNDIDNNDSTETQSPSINKTVKINVVMPDGTPALAMAKLIAEYKTTVISNTKYELSYEIVAGAAEVSQKVAGGKADIAIVPTNLAAKLYNKGTKIGLVASNIYGSLYMIGKTDINSPKDLISKKIAFTGQSGTPEYIMRYVLENNGVNVDTDLEAIAVSNGSEALAMIKQNTAFAAVVGEPVASMAKANGMKIVMDFQKEYKTLTDKDGYPQASTIATQELINNHSAFLVEFYEKLKDNITYINSIDAKDLTNMLQENGSAVTFPNTESVVNSNVRAIIASEAKEGIEAYLSIMGSFDATFYGGKMPDDNFYFKIND